MVVHFEYLVPGLGEELKDRKINRLDVNEDKKYKKPGTLSNVAIESMNTIGNFWIFSHNRNS